MNTEGKQQYAPPAGPPPKKPLKTHRVTGNYNIDLEQLASKGWARLDIAVDSADPLHTPYDELFKASAQFFHLPQAERAKYRITTLTDGQRSEEGYSAVRGEKKMITLRKAETTPTEFGLREKARDAWKASALVMWDVLRAIEESLEMDDGALLRMMEAQLEMPGDGEENVASLMRMFRYIRPCAPAPPPSAQSSNESSESGSNGPGTAMVTATKEVEPRVVAEPHKDLGLLTIVIGHSPGLECYDPAKQEWDPCEPNEGLNATIMTGQELVKFTNGRYVAGRHRVLVHPSHISRQAPDANGRTEADHLTSPKYRFSLVHALRAHTPLRVSSSEFETPVTGIFSPSMRFENVLVGQIYKAISDAHWSVNIAVVERRRQERRLRDLAERKRKERERMEQEKVEKAEENASKPESGIERQPLVDEKANDEAMKRSCFGFLTVRRFFRKTPRHTALE